MITRIALILSASLLTACEEPSPQKLKLNLDRDSVTVSGISSGGYMAHQFHIAHSELVSGAALFASGPYGCSQGDLKVALKNCVGIDGQIDTEALYQNIVELSDSQKISDIKNLEGDKVYIFHGTEDVTVGRSIVEAQDKLYKSLSVEVDAVLDIPSGHGWPTSKAGNQCSSSESPFVNQCNYDSAEKILKLFYPNLSEHVALKGKVVSFQQGLYSDENTLADTGFAFIPESCAKGERCQLHISFHGCSQNYETIDKAFIKQSGINEWAEANNLVVIYPQTKSTYVPLNPKACWDWWGYTGPNFQTKNGKQIRQIYNIVKNIGL